MQEAEFLKLKEQGEDHWWYRARRRLVELVLRKHFSMAAGLQILDLGSACGDNFAFAGHFGSVVGIDLSPTAIRICRDKGISSIVQGDAQALPFDDQSFDVVIALDIFEHLPDDRLAIRETFRVLKPGGILIANVPAFMSLFSAHDQAFNHLRRYQERELIEKLRTCGFETSTRSYWSFFIFPLVYLNRKLSGQKHSDFHLKTPGWIDAVLTGFSWLEFRFIALGGKFPWGVSCFCTGIKKG